MTSHEITAFIISRWRLEHDLASIMMSLIMYRAAMPKAQILRVIRAYCDNCSENRAYSARRRGD